VRPAAYTRAVPAGRDTPSTRPLLDRLGVKAGMRALVEGPLEASFLNELAERTGAAAEPASAGGVADLVFLAAPERSALGRVAALRPLLDADGALWVVRPKGSKDIREQEVLRAGLDAGLVDVKVVSFSPTQTAEKFVYRLADREEVRRRR
jgi:hypothetical protein